MRSQITRRSAIRSIVATSAFAVCPRLFASDSTQATKQPKVVDYIHPKMLWSYAEFNEFIDVLPDDGVVSLQKSLQLIPHDSKSVKIKNRVQAKRGIQEQLLWVSHNALAYPFCDEEKIDYHNLTKWVGGDLGVDQWILDTQPTFVIERAIQEKLFVDIWDKMNHKQRKEVLRKIDADGHLANHVAIASLSGAGALAAFSMTVHFAGFAFYTTMSTVICTVAGFFGVTLPFAAYTGASTAVAFLAGPFGWAILAVAAAAGVAIAGRASTRKTAAAICQIHALKVAALAGANKTDPDIFQAMGNPLKRQLVGRWQFFVKNESIELSLESDGAFTVKCSRLSKTNAGSSELLWEGKGDWSVRDKRLTVKRTHTSRWYGWMDNSRMLFDNVAVRKVSQTTVELTNRQKMVRL